LSIFKHDARKAAWLFTIKTMYSKMAVLIGFQPDGTLNAGDQKATVASDGFR